MKKRIAIVTGILVIAALGAIPLMAEGPHGGRGPHGMNPLGPLGHLMHAKEELGLSDQQVDEIKAIFGDLREQNESYREQLRGGVESATQTLIADPNNLAAAQAQLDQQLAAERALRSNLLAAASKALNVLTPAQRTKLSEMIAEHKAMRAERRRG